LFIVFDGFCAWRWPRIAYAHIASVVWGALIEFAEWICPLTPLENYLRAKAGASAYRGSFTEHYIVPLNPCFTRDRSRSHHVIASNGVIHDRIIQAAQRLLPGSL